MVSELQITADLTKSLVEDDIGLGFCCFVLALRQTQDPSGPALFAPKTSLQELYQSDAPPTVIGSMSKAQVSIHPRIIENSKHGLVHVANSNLQHLLHHQDHNHLLLPHSYKHNLQQPLLLINNTIKTITYTTNSPLLGDFNAHHQLWHSLALVGFRGKLIAGTHSEASFWSLSSTSST